MERGPGLGAERPSSPVDERAQLRAAAEAHYRKGLAQLDREERFAWRSLWAGVLAIPVGALWGWVAGALVAGTVLVFFACSFYLVRGRRFEYEGILRDLHDDEER